jgi:hypothetical protein
MNVLLRVSRFWGVDVRTYGIRDWRRAHKIRRAIEQRKVI